MDGLPLWVALKRSVAERACNGQVQATAGNYFSIHHKIDRKKLNAAFLHSSAGFLMMKLSCVAFRRIARIQKSTTKVGLTHRDMSHMSSIEGWIELMPHLPHTLNCNH